MEIKDADYLQLKDQIDGLRKICDDLHLDLTLLEIPLETASKKFMAVGEIESSCDSSSEDIS